MDPETRTFPTMLGGASGAPAADDSRLPAEAHGGWRIELRSLPIDVPLVDRGHAFLRLVDPDGETRGELHGLAFSRNAPVPTLQKPEKSMMLGVDDSRLKGVHRNGQVFDGPTEKVGEAAHGSYDDIVRGKWARGLRAADEMNRRNLDYKADDLAYELFGGSGGQIQNSNSAAYTYGKRMDLDLDGVLEQRGIERRFPGWGRDLLDPTYKPYVAPPPLPGENENRG